MNSINRLRSGLAAARFEEALKRIDAKHPWLQSIKTLPEIKETK